MSNGRFFGIIFAILAVMWSFIIISITASPIGTEMIDFKPFPDGEVTSLFIMGVVTILLIAVFFIDLSIENFNMKSGDSK
jgi:hypothetical protein